MGDGLVLKSDCLHFCVQAFKIVPYNTETLDKLLTESLKNNIPASGLHLFGVNQLEEEDMMTSKSAAQPQETVQSARASCSWSLLYSPCSEKGSFFTG